MLKTKQHVFSSWRLGVLAFSLLFSFSPAADTTQPTIDPALMKELRNIDAQTAAIIDLTAEFEQKKFSPLLKKPLVSRGTILARGTATLWITEKPEPTRMRIDAASMQIYYPGRKQIEAYPLKGKLAAMAASPLPRLATLIDPFDITQENLHSTDDSILLLLTPRADELKQYVKQVHVTIYIQPQHPPQVIEFELIDPDGERTTIHFYHQKTNQNLPAAALDLNAPPGTDIVHPLGPGQ